MVRLHRIRQALPKNLTNGMAEAPAWVSSAIAATSSGPCSGVGCGCGRNRPRLPSVGACEHRKALAALRADARIVAAVIPGVAVLQAATAWHSRGTCLSTLSTGVLSKLASPGTRGAGCGRRAVTATVPGNVRLRRHTPGAQARHTGELAVQVFRAPCNECVVVGS